MSNTADPYNRRHAIIGTPEVHLALGATSLVHARQLGFQIFPSLDKLGVEVETEVKKKMRPCRGLKQVGATSNRKFDLMYKLTLGALGVSELKLLYHGDKIAGNTSRAALNNIAGTPFNFDTGAEGVAYPLGKGMQLLDEEGDAVSDLTAVIVSGGNATYGIGQDSNSLTENVDYEVDLKLGFIYFKKAIDDDVITVQLTAPAITADGVAGFLQGISPGSKFTHRGYGNAYVFDDDEDDKLAYKHVDFQFEMTANSGPSIGDDDFAEVEVEMTIINPQKSKIYARPNLDFWGKVLP